MHDYLLSIVIHMITQNYVLHIVRFRMCNDMWWQCMQAKQHELLDATRS